MALSAFPCPRPRSLFPCLHSHPCRSIPLISPSLHATRTVLSHVAAHPATSPLVWAAATAPRSVERSDPSIEENGALFKVLEEQGLGKGAGQTLEGKRNGSMGRERSVHDYMELAPQFITSDGGPPRWFCPLDCGPPPKDAPVLLFLPGMDGTGLGMILHHTVLGKLFEVCCLHIPVQDRTSFEGLARIVEAMLHEIDSNMNLKPIYIVGDSLGGALALTVAARNPTMDLVLILSNPATCFDRSQLQPLLPLLHMLPNELYHTMPYLLSFTIGNPILMAMVNVQTNLSPLKQVQQLSDNLVALLPTLPRLSNVIPKEALLWKLKLLHSAAAYTNSRLHAVKAEVLLLVSGKDQVLPSTEEAKRLRSSLRNCRVRYFKDNGHTLLLERMTNLATVIKSTGLYRRFMKRDCVEDFIPPTPQEFDATEHNLRFLEQWISPIFFSTVNNGKIVKGLTGVPREGPLLFVGNHMLLGLESGLIVKEFFKQRKQLVHGAAHPFLFTNSFEGNMVEPLGIPDLLRLFGAVPVSGKNLFKLLANNKCVLLYPGGEREGLHRKDEEYKLFWPNQPEFVRMAARFNATIVPFSAVGEDEILEVCFDYDDFKINPIINKLLKQGDGTIPRIRSEADGEAYNQFLRIPIIAPKLPGRLYVLFGRPYLTTGRRHELQNKERAYELYWEIKREIEVGISYLQEKRKQDPCRDLLSRLVYEFPWGNNVPVPTFDP
eukprot:c28408_g1_i2 orf=78-2234(+)